MCQAPYNISLSRHLSHVGFDPATGNFDVSLFTYFVNIHCRLTFVLNHAWLVIREFRSTRPVVLKGLKCSHHGQSCTYTHTTHTCTHTHTHTYIHGVEVQFIALTITTLGQ